MIPALMPSIMPSKVDDFVIPNNTKGIKYCQKISQKLKKEFPGHFGDHLLKKRELPSCSVKVDMGLIKRPFVNKRDQKFLNKTYDIISTDPFTKKKGKQEVSQKFTLKQIAEYSCKPLEVSSIIEVESDWNHSDKDSGLQMIREIEQKYLHSTKIDEDEEEATFVSNPGQAGDHIMSVSNQNEAIQIDSSFNDGTASECL